MKNYKIIVTYNGTKYSGWQKQGNTDNTIQGKIESVLSKIAKSKIELNGSGRTDGGVHARYQVANFKMDIDKTNEELLLEINKYLPKDIAITEIEVVHERFHSRLNAKSKTYEYIINAGIRDVFRESFMYHIDFDLDLQKMINASKDFVGEHNFLPFSSVKKSKKSTIRRIESIDIYKENNNIHFIVKGNGFLYNTIRIIIGTLVEIGQGKRKNDIKSIFEENTRENAGITMPPCGLCLIGVEY